MNIQLSETNSGGRYFVETSDGTAEMTFSNAGETRIIDHTGVPDAMRGQGYGEALVLRGVEDARAQGKTIIPLCPFAAAQFRRHGREWADVLSK